MVTWEYPPHMVGGLGTYAGAMVPALRSAGHEVEVFSALRNDVSAPADGTHWARVLGLPSTYEAIPNQGASSWGLFLSELYSANLYWADAIRRQHRAAPFDILAIHDWLAAPCALMLSRHINVPIVLHIHSTEWGRQPDTPSPVVSGWELAAGQAANATITVSNAMVEDLIDHGWQPELVHAIWNGVDTDVFDPRSQGGPALRARYGLSKNTSVVLFIGRLTGVKGIINLLTAWPDISSHHPNAHLVVLGTGDLNHDAHQMVANLNIQSSVSLITKWVEDPERVAHFLAADLVVLPSTYEPFGIVGLEAMACERAVVVGTTGVVGFREQVVGSGPERCGIHVDANDPEDVSRGIRTALSNPQQLHDWGKNGRRRAATMFTWEKAASRTLNVYQGLL